MFWQSFLSSLQAVLQILFLAGIGYLLVKKKVLGEACLETLSRLVIEVTLPAMVFVQLIGDFSFQKYPDWWVFPLLSFGVTAIGLAAGWIFGRFLQGHARRIQFASLIGFQNAGYLPLALIPVVVPRQAANEVLVMLFLFLLGFNLVVFSVGAALLGASRVQRFEFGMLASPVVVSIIASLLAVALRLPAVIPAFIRVPLEMTGACTVPLALFVVGGGLAQIDLRRLEWGALILMSLVKLVLLPLGALVVLRAMRFPQLIGLLLLLEFAMPPATSLSALTARYKKEDHFISQGIFIGHVLSVLTIPLFLSLYFAWAVIQ